MLFFLILSSLISESERERERKREEEGEGEGRKAGKKERKDCGHQERKSWPRALTAEFRDYLKYVCYMIKKVKSP